TPLDSNEIRNTIGTDKTAELSKRRLVKPGGMSLFTFAADAGFDSTVDAINAVYEAKTFEEAVQDRVEGILAEREAQATEGEQVPGSDAYHSEDMSEALVERLTALQKIIERKNGTPGSRIDYLAAREAARNIISRQTVSNATAYHKYAQAEMIYSRKAMAAARRYASQQRKEEQRLGKKGEAAARKQGATQERARQQGRVAGQAQREADLATEEAIARTEVSEAIAETDKQVGQAAAERSADAGVRIAGRKQGQAEAKQQKSEDTAARGEEQFTAAKEDIAAQREASPDELLAEAEKYTRLQVLNHIMAAQAIQAQRYREAALKRSKKLHRTKPGMIMVDYHEAIRRVMYLFGMHDKDMVRPDTDAFIELLDEIEYGADPYPVPAFIRTASTPTKYNELTMDQFTQLVTLITVLGARGRNQVILNEEGKAQQVEEVSAACVAPMQDRKGTKVPNKQKKLFWAIKIIRSILAETSHVLFDMKRADKYTNVGKKKNVMGPNEMLFDAVARARTGMAAAAEQFNNDHLNGITKRMATFFDKWVKKYGRNPVQIKGVNNPLAWSTGQEVTYSGWDAEKALAAMLNIGNKGNLDAMVDGMGMTYDDIQSLARAMVEIDPEIPALLNDVWASIDTLFKGMDDTHNRMNGYRVKKVEAQPYDIELEGGEVITLNGGYYPLMFDRELSRKVAGFSEQELLKQERLSIHHRNKPRDGFTGERKGGKYPPSLSINGLFRHVNDTLRYTHMAGTLTDMHKVISTDEYAEAYSKLLGADRYNRLTPWLSHIGNPSAHGNDMLERLMHRYQRLTGIYVFAGNLSSGVKQALSLSSAAQEMGWANVAVGMYKVARNPLKAVRDVEKMSTFMRDRASVVEQEIARQFERQNPFTRGITIAGKRLTLKDMQDLAFVFIRMGDIMGAYPTWVGRYNQVLAETDGDHNKAVKAADRLVQESQPVSNEVFRNMWQIGGANTTAAGKAIRWAVSPFSGWTMLFGSRSRAYFAGWRDGEISTKDFAMHVFNERILPAVLGTAITMGFSDREDDEPWKTYTWDMIGYNVSWAPFLNTIPSMAKYGSMGGVTELPTGKPLKEIAKVTFASGSFIAGNEQELDDLFKMYAGIAEYHFGVPVFRAYKNIRKVGNLITEGDEE
ncbi:hypothetical protein OAG36_01120, partial [bacterium]|nr:hypothetical protein [bacterium]